jgi:hypothetical protein
MRLELRRLQLPQTARMPSDGGGWGGVGQEGVLVFRAVRCEALLSG